MFPLTLSFADIRGLGRMDATDLTDQQAIELFFVPSNINEFRAQLAGDHEDACTWTGVLCSSDLHIESISWLNTDVHLTGEINFHIIPPRLVLLRLYAQKLSGEMDTSDLPQKLEIFSARRCFFSGMIDLGSLPETLTQFVTESNLIVSIHNVHSLPKNLQVLQIRERNVTQSSIHVGALPETRLTVNLKGCGIQDVTVDREADRDRVEIVEQQHRGCFVR